MAVTATVKETNKIALDQANPNKLADALAKVQLGTLLTPLKRVFTGLTAALSFDLTTIDGTGEVVGSSNPLRLAALMVGPLRVTAGAATAGVRTVGDVDATPSATVATISDDGKTLTFEANVTAFVVEYIPRSAADMNDLFARE